MSTSMIETDTILVPGAPDIEGLRFRHFRGESEFPEMLRVYSASKLADGIQEADSLDDLVRNYSNLKNSDVNKDLVMVEVNGQLIGYKRVYWVDEVKDGPRLYSHFGFLVPEWRHKGIGRALILHSEARLREIAAEHPTDREQLFDTWTMDASGMSDLLKKEGYVSIRQFYEMVRPDLENLPDVPMPEGIEVRPVQPEHFRTIWEAEVEAFQDHWGMEEVEEADFVRWNGGRYFQPHLWQVAWDGDQVVGMVRNYIMEEENETFNRKRGYTENISVRRAWRKRGVARALIARSFQLLKDMGMTEAALGVDSENPNGARQLYESMGFRTTKTGSAYRKPF